jgi:hypothetical protein
MRINSTGQRSAQEIQSSRYTSPAVNALTTCPLTFCWLPTKPNSIQYVSFQLTVWNSLHGDSCKHFQRIKIITEKTKVFKSLHLRDDDFHGRNWASAVEGQGLLVLKYRR